MRELRPREKSRAKNIRIVFGFGPHRHAIFLVAGDKTGQWNKWYSKHIPRADERFGYHLKQLKKGN